MSQVKKAQYELEDGNRVQKALSIIVRDQSTGNRNNNLAIIENSGIFLETLKNYSIKHDLARSCFQLWPKIGDEGDKISRNKTGEALAETVFSRNFVTLVADFGP